MVRQLPTPAALILEALLLNRIWPDNPVNRRYRGLALDYSTRMAVEQPAGAFLMVRRAVWRELGGFDEGFFPLWFEDVDFCRRVADRGYHLYYVPEAVAKHTGAHSIRQLTVEMRRVYWYCSLLRYSAKHFRPGAFRVVCLAVVTGSLLRSIAESVLDRSLKPLAAYGKVVRLASRCLLFGSAPNRLGYERVKEKIGLGSGSGSWRKTTSSPSRSLPTTAAASSSAAWNRCSPKGTRSKKSSSSITPPPTAPSTSSNSSRTAARSTTTRKTSVSRRRRTRPSSFPTAIGC